MSETGITLPELRAAFDDWAGRPVHVIELRRGGPSDRVPTEMDVLFFQPSEQDGLPDEESFTLVATAGVSTRLMPGPCPHVELLMRVQGRQALGDLRALGRALAEFAVLPFRQGTYLEPNLVVREAEFPLFRGATSALVTNVGVRSPTWLPGVRPPVQLLSVRPLYEAEADVIEQIGDVEAARRFKRERVNWDEPGRAAARLRGPGVSAGEGGNEMPTGKKAVKKAAKKTATKAAAKAAAKAATKIGGAGAGVEAEVQEIWRELDEWYGKNAPGVLKNLREGASDEQLREFEKRAGLTLPDDYRASLKTHDGDAYLYEYNYLSLEKVSKNWARMTELAEGGTLKGKGPRGAAASSGVIQKAWWHRGWIPFAEDGGGNLLCIDTSPGPKGAAGQVLRMEVHSGPSPTGQKSFLSWLADYRDDLLGGKKYMVDKYGFILEKY